ncbi:MAG: IclR family transcriptional regulator [Clostridiales bacterium]|nr:IclR family transcriptional regulator [Clostridiales bacterium]
MKDIVQSVDRSLELLTVLSNYPRGISIGDLSKNVNLAKSTVHRLLNTLVYKGFVKQNDIDNSYKLTFRLFELGSSIMKDNPLKDAAHLYLEELRNKTGEVVHLVVPDEASIIYIDKFDTNQTIRMHSTIGKRSAMYCTSVGKAILSTYSDERIKELWNQSEINKLTEYTITDFDSFMDEIEKIRKLGYAEDNQENELQVRCFGAAIKDYSKETIGAISISTPMIRLTEEKIELFKMLVIEYSQRISKELGY